MVTPQSTASVPSASANAPSSARTIALWLVFAATLVTGLILALRFGGTVPVMLEGVPR